MKKNTPLMLDSTVLKQVPNLNSELFKELIKYCRANLYSLHISEVVENEFLTCARDEAQSAYEKVVKATKSLEKYYTKAEGLFAEFLNYNPTTFTVGSQVEKTISDIRSNWSDFKEKTNATLIPIHPEHGREVMVAYFNGSKPFSGVKVRKDIPDSFVFCAIKEILKSNKEVVFVSADREFTKSIHSERVICFNNLSELFESGPAKLDSRYFKSLDANNKFISLTRIYEEDIHKKLVSELEFSDHSDLFSDIQSEGCVGKYSDMSICALEVDKDFEHAKEISYLSFLVSFKATLECIVNSYAERGEVIVMSEHKLQNIDKEITDDGLFKLAEKRLCSVHGHFSVRFDDSDPSTWKEQKSGLLQTRQIEEITVNLEDIEKGD